MSHDNQNQSNYFYGTMRGDGLNGLDADNESPLISYRNHIIETESISAIDEIKINNT